MAETVREFVHNGVPVRAIFSTRRTRSVQANWQDDTFVIRVPAYMGMPNVLKYVDSLMERAMKRRKHPSEEELLERANYLNAAYLEGLAKFTSIRWVANQNKRWASVTLATGEIRVSDRLKKVPQYVLDSVIIHELAHTIAPDGHNAEFWSYANRAPQAERAAGYLEAFQTFGVQPSG